jgi:hypothetical protein
MKPNETTNELLTQITRTVRVIKESFKNYGAITLDPHNDINHGISNQTFRTFKRRYTAMMYNFFKMNLFKAALTPEVRAVVAQRDQEQMTVKRMYKHATTAQEKAKPSHRPQSTRSTRTTAPPKLRTTKMTSPPLTEKEPGPKQTSQVDNHEEVTLPDEEVTNPDQEPGEEEMRVVETTEIGMEDSATFARSKGTDKKSAGNESRRTSPAETHKDEPIGPGSISWMRTQTRRP